LLIQCGGVKQYHRGWLGRTDCEMSAPAPSHPVLKNWEGGLNHRNSGVVMPPIFRLGQFYSPLHPTPRYWIALNKSAFHTHRSTGDIVIGYECESLEELEILEEEIRLDFTRVLEEARGKLKRRD
jgi:hypothetical protein